jgi:hypothetical protein
MKYELAAAIAQKLGDAPRRNRAKLRRRESVPLGPLFHSLCESGRKRGEVIRGRHEHIGRRRPRRRCFVEQRDALGFGDIE